MKVWNGYGSEHSMNLVMIGHFENSDDAIKTQQMIERLTEGLDSEAGIRNSGQRFSSSEFDLLRETDCNMLSPSELDQFQFDLDTRVDGKKIVLTTEETDVSAFFKIMLHQGAKIEIYSAHDFPDSKYGRGR